MREASDDSKQKIPMATTWTNTCMHAERLCVAWQRDSWRYFANRSCLISWFTLVTQQHQAYFLQNSSLNIPQLYSHWINNRKSLIKHPTNDQNQANTPTFETLVQMLVIIPIEFTFSSVTERHSPASELLCEVLERNFYSATPCCESYSYCSTVHWIFDNNDH